MKHNTIRNTLQGVLTPSVVIIGTALMAQFLGSYHARSYVIGENFYLGWVVLRIVLPVAVILALRLPFAKIGLGRPQFDRATRRVMIIAAAVLLLAFTGIYFMRGYFAYYSHAFGSAGAGGLERFVSFMVFTGSTLTGWEFMHRGFLLMGLSYVLAEREDVRPETALKLAVAVVWVFEVVFHFIKPELEAFGLLLGSPFLSWLAIRTGSIWPSFLLHLMVELLFIIVLIFQ